MNHPRGRVRPKDKTNGRFDMGIFAYQHAENLVAAHGAMRRHKQIENGVTPVKNTLLSASGHSLLMHMALSVFEQEDCIRDGYWNQDDGETLYYKGLAKRAKALGYELPDDFQKHMVAHGDVDEKLYNAARMATDRALNELGRQRLIRLVSPAHAGKAARYALDFLEWPCRICVASRGNGSQYADIAQHLDRR